MRKFYSFPSMNILIWKELNSFWETFYFIKEQLGNRACASLWETRKRERRESGHIEQELEHIFHNCFRLISNIKNLDDKHEKNHLS